MPGEVTFAICGSNLERVALVADDGNGSSSTFPVIAALKLLVEPSGAAPAAALMRGRIPAVAGRK